MAAKKTSRAKSRKTVTRAKATRKSTVRSGRKSPGDPGKRSGPILIETI
jgi:hypothetical protein